MKDSTLFKQIVSRSPNIDQDKLCQELDKAQGHSKVLFNKPLNCAFIWDESPQGHEFWEDIHCGYGIK